MNTLNVVIHMNAPGCMGGNALCGDDNIGMVAFNNKDANCPQCIALERLMSKPSPYKPNVKRKIYNPWNWADELEICLAPDISTIFAMISKANLINIYPIRRHE